MKIPPAKSLLFGALLLLSGSAHSLACTWFEFTNDLNHPFVGRTMEWPGDLHGEITIVPRNHDLGYTRTQYGFVGMSHGGLFSDGINEHGLAVSALWLSASAYPAKGKTTTPHRHPAGPSPRQYPHGRRGKGLHPEDNLPHFRQHSDTRPPAGAALCHLRPSGRSIVVEFLKGKTKIYENKVGVMTNDPPYEEQLAIWSKYRGKTFNEDTFEAFDYSRKAASAAWPPSMPPRPKCPAISQRSTARGR